MDQDSNDRPSLSKSSGKFKKPRPDFPLSVRHDTGYFYKKVKGKCYYFGRVSDDPNGAAALEEWLRVKDDPVLLAGGEPRAKSDELTVRDLVNRFLTHKGNLRDNGELSPRSFQSYHATCEKLLKVLGKTRTVVSLTPDDFRKLRLKLAESRKAAVALRNEMQRIRSLFKFAFDDGLILTPVRFGQSFTKPKLDAVRRAREEHRNKNGDRMFEAEELRLMLDYLEGKVVALSALDGETGEALKVKGKDNPALKAMLLLAANCGFGQTDISSLPTRAVNLDTGWLDFARVKTAVPRNVPLWPETVAAIRDWIKVRPAAKDPSDDGLLFVTCRGQRWVKCNEKGLPCDALGQEFSKILKKLKLKRPGVNFYALRHGFETIAGETADQVAVDAIMGHVPQGMAGAYRERIGNDRLRRVVDHVRNWLYAQPRSDGQSTVSVLTRLSEVTEEDLMRPIVSIDPLEGSSRGLPISYPKYDKNEAYEETSYCETVINLLTETGR